MWANNCSRRQEKNSWLLVTALVSIVKGNSSIIANKGGGDYSKRLKISLQQCKISMKQYLQIEQSKTSQHDDVNEYRL
jgi:hypothetical protein